MANPKNQDVVADAAQQGDIVVTNNLKRRIAVGVAIAAVVGVMLSACSAPAATTTSTGKVNSAAMVKEIGANTLDKSVLCAGGKNYTIGFNAFSQTDAFEVALWAKLQQLATQLGCVKFNRLIDNESVTQAVQNANVFVQQKVDGVMLFNVIAAAAPGQAKVLKKAGIPDVTIGIPAPGVPFISPDETAAGGQAGTALGKAFEASSKAKDGEPYVIVGRNDVTGQAGVQRMDGATKGVEAAISGLPTSHVLSIQAADAATAQKATLSVLGNVPSGSEILLTGINDDTTYGMFRAVVQANRQKDTIVVALGAVRPTGLNYICTNPEYAGGVSYAPDRYAYYMLPSLIAAINGAKLPSNIVLKTSYLARSDISTVYPDFKCGGQ
jgi:ABC-type sugar transport system substrate-binding protein